MTASINLVTYRRIGLSANDLYVILDVIRDIESKLSIMENASRVLYELLPPTITLETL